MRRRVIALLVAFAVLAERAADGCAPVRLLLLWILRRAETAGAAFVFEQTGLPPRTLEGPGGIAAVGNGPADALRLAARFRALAAALRALLPDGHRRGRPARRGYAFGTVLRGFDRRPDGWMREPYDTS